MSSRIRFSVLSFVVGMFGPVFAEVAQAEPVFLEPKALADGTLVNPTSSSLLKDSIDQDVVWVVPPATGWVENLGRKKNPVLTEFFVRRACDEFDSLQDQSRILQNETYRLAQALAELMYRVSDGEDEADCLEAETWEQLHRRKDVQNRFFAIKEFVVEKERLVQSLQEDWELECAGTRRDCQELDEQIRIAKAQLEELASTLEQIQEVLDEIDANIASLKKQKDEVWAAIDTLKDELVLRQEAIASRERELLAMYANLARQPGDQVRFAYRSGLQENLKKLRRANPRFVFKPVEGVKVRLHANMVPKLLVDDYLTRLPAVLGFQIEGRELTGGSLAFDRLPESFEGTMQLSMIGTCPARKNGGEALPDHTKGDALFGTVATYEFDARVGASFSMSYDEAKVRGYLATRLRGGGISDTGDLRMLAKELIRLDFFGFRFGDKSMLHLEMKALKEKLVIRVIEAMLAKYGFGRLYNVDVNWFNHSLAAKKPSLSSTFVQGVKRVEGRYLDTQWRVSPPSHRSLQSQNVTRRSGGDPFPVTGSVTYLPKE